jgi:hypothetical protein
VVTGLAVLCLQVLGLWWWQGANGAERGVAQPISAEVEEQRLPGSAAGGES